MNKHNERSIKDAIQDLLRAYGLEERMNEVKLVNSWEKVMGKMISRHTKGINIKDKCLFLKLDSAPLKHELSYARTKLVKMLNDELGVEVINDVIIQ